MFPKDTSALISSMNTIPHPVWDILEKKMRHRIQPYYNWKSMRKTIHEHVNDCTICQQTKARNHKPYGFLEPLHQPEIKWTEIPMDCIVLLPRAKNSKDGMVNFVYRLSRMMCLIPITKDIDAPGVATLFRNMFADTIDYQEK